MSSAWAGLAIGISAALLWVGPAAASPSAYRSAAGLKWSRLGTTREVTADRAVIIERTRGHVFEPGGRRLFVACESGYFGGADGPFRLACAVTTTQTSTEAVLALAATASVGAPYRGWALTRTSSVPLESDQRDHWMVRSSSTGEALAWLSRADPPHFRDGMSPASQRGLAAILLVLSSASDLRADPQLGRPRPGLVRLASDGWSPPPGREALAARFQRLGGASLARAFLDLGRPLPAQDPELEAQLQMERYDAQEGWGVSLAMGSWALIPLGDPAASLPRESTGVFITTLGFDLGRRLEAHFAFGWGGRSLDDAALERRLGPGRVEDLTHFETANASYSGSVGSLHVMGGLRYAVADWAWRPYVGLFAGRRMEFFKFDSPDVPASCGDQSCPHRAGFRIAAPTGGWVVAPALGIRRALIHGEHLGLEVRAEALAHVTFWGRPPLFYQGEVTPGGLEAYQRFRALDDGGPALALGLGLTLEARAGF